MAEPLPAPDPILYFDPQLLMEIALGADHPHDIAEKHGLDAVEYEHLTTLPWFVELVGRKRQELNDQGYLFQAKAAMMAEALLQRLFQQSMAGQLTAPIQIEVSKQLVDIGRLKPQPGILPANSGPGFQINIQINGDTAPRREPAPAGELVSSPVDNSGPVTMVLDLPSTVVAPLPPPPSYIHAAPPPNFDRDATVRRGWGSPVTSLAGTPQAQQAVTSPSPGLPSKPTLR